MRHRFVLPIIFFVAAVHWLVIFESPPWTALGSIAQPPIAPTPLQAIWVEPKPIAQATAPTPQPSAPRKATLPQPRKMVTRHTATSTPSITPTEPPAATTDDAASLLALAETALPEAPPSPHAEANDAFDTHSPPAPAGPPLQVHSSAGDAVTVALPTDGSALPQQMLLRFKVHGFVKGMEYHANAELQWTAEGDHYQARQSISAFLLGSMEQTSTGLLTQQGLQPLQFTDRRFAKRRSVTLDWETLQATFEPVREPAPIGPGAQDRLSVFLQLASMLQALPELREPGTRIDIPTLGSRRLQMWTFVVEQADTVELPSGPVSTLRLQRQPQAGDDDKAQLWVNPTQGYVPVRIRMEERNGDVMDLSLKP